MGGNVSWNYDYTLVVENNDSHQPVTMELDVDGQYYEAVSGGFENVTVPAGSYNAYALTNSYSVDFDGIDMGTGTPYGAFTRSGTLTQWYAEGIGLIKEEHAYTTTDEGKGSANHEVTKELSSVSGL